MVSKKVLSKIGVFAVAALMSASFALPVKAAVDPHAVAVDPKATERDEKDFFIPEIGDFCNDEVMTEDGMIAWSTIGGDYLASGVRGVAILSSEDDVKDAFFAEKKHVEAFTANGIDSPGRDGMSIPRDVMWNMGNAIRVEVKDSWIGRAMAGSDAVCGQAALKGINEILDSIEGAERGAIVQIKGYVDERNASVTKLRKAITISFDMKETFRDSSCDYAVIRINDKKMTILPDTDDDNYLITVETDELGEFVLIKAPAGSFDAF